MRFEPISEENLRKEYPVLEQGMGDFEVLSAIEKKSKAGNDMIELKIKAWDCNGTEGLIFDYLVSNVQWKLLQFLKGVGLQDLYETGQIDPKSFVGLCGKIKIISKKDNEGKDRNAIGEYVEKTSKPKSSDPIPDFDPDEDVPDFF